MSKIYVILFFAFLNAYSINNNNSIFNISKNARSNSLSGIHSLSNNVSGIFNQPINMDYRIKGDTYFSYFSYFNNSVDVLQFALCLKSEDKSNLSVGILRRNIKDNFNTENAWIYSDNGPSFNGIDYSNISKFSDSEIGFLVSISSKITPSLSINFKLKPNYHKVLSKFAYGFGTDILIHKNINEFNFILGIKDVLSFKKWNNGTEEVYNPILYINASYNFKDKFLLFLETNTFKDKSFGAEHIINKIFFIRYGYNNLKNISFGVGVETEAINFNYCYLKFDDSNISYVNQYSLILKLEGMKKIYKGLKI